MRSCNCVCYSYEVGVQAGETLATVLSSEAADTLSTPKSEQLGAGCVRGEVCASWQEEEGNLRNLPKESNVI